MASGNRSALTGALLANYLFDVKNAEAIYTGRSLSVEDLGVEASKRIHIEGELAHLCHSFSISPQPEFWSRFLAGQSKRRDSEGSNPPGRTRRIVVSGPFHLQERQPHDRIVFYRNPAYYNAASVRLEELCFLQIADGVTNVEPVQSRRGRFHVR